MSLEHREVANNLDEIRCTACNRIFQAREIVWKNEDGTYTHVVCPEHAKPTQNT